jgi:hypothetical protein
MNKPRKPSTGPNVMQILGDPAKSEELFAGLAAEGLLTNAVLMKSYSRELAGEIGITEAMQALRSTIKEVNRGDLSAAEAILVGQAAALNAIFAEMARRCALNLGEHLGATETYMRLALKAQGQCRATLETLAAIKNPPVVFARQANINNGGQQQVNNGPAPPKADQYPPASAHPGETVSTPTELLEDCTHGRTQLDPGAAPATSRAHSELVPVGALDRPAHR